MPRLPGAGGWGAPSVDAVHVAGLAEVQFDAGDSPRTSQARTSGFEVHVVLGSRSVRAVLGLARAVRREAVAGTSIAAEVGVHLGDVDDVGGFLAVTRTRAR